MNLFGELKRRNVFRVGVAYLVVGWLIVQLIDTLVPLLGVPDWVGKAIFLAIVAGFPIALLFAWAFEITPDGLKKTGDIESEASITAETGARLNYLIAGALALALAYIAYSEFTGAPSDTANEAVKAAYASIAVLPFVNMSDDTSNEYFSDGISEEILNVLSRIPNLQVTSRSSAFQFKGGNIDIPTVARQLNVAHVLEGSVRKSGTQVRITVQLIDASTDKHLWSASYDRELTDIFAVQDEISAAIVDALKTTLGLELAAPAAKTYVADSEAHEAYLRGRHLVVQRTRTTVEGAVSEFEGAIKLDPDYALAHAELAIATLLLRRSQYGGLTDSEATARAAPHAERALALDPTLAEAHAATGFVSWDRQNMEQALTHFEHAIGINPNYSIVYNWMATLVGNDLGRYDESFAAYEKALRLDPLSIPAIGNYMRLLIWQNRFEEADRELKKLASIAPAMHANMRGQMTSVGGQWANAVLGDLDALRIDPEDVWSRMFLAWEFAAIGLPKEALAISGAPRPFVLSMLGRPEDAVTTGEARLAEEPDSIPARGNLGVALAGAGDYARARPILEELWQRKGGLVTRFFGRFRVTHAAALIAIRRAADDDADVDDLLTAITDNARRYRQAGMTMSEWFVSSADYDEGLVAFLAGEREAGLKLIAKTVDEGFFILPNEAYLQALYDDPGFAAIRAGQEAIQARERDKFLAIVCADNPYAAVWQPEEGTC